MDKLEQEQYLISLRREKVQSLLCQGKSQTAISHTLNTPLSTIHSDVLFLRAHARDYISRYDEHFSEQYKQVLDFLDLVLAKSWDLANSIKYERNAVSALALCKDCILAKAALIADVSLIDRTVLFIEDLKKKKRVKRLLDDNEEDDISSSSSQVSEMHRGVVSGHSPLPRQEDRQDEEEDGDHIYQEDEEGEGDGHAF